VYRTARAEAEHAASYLAMRAEFDSEFEDDVESDVGIVLDAARGLLSEVQDWSSTGSYQDVVGADGMTFMSPIRQLRSLSPPASSPSEVHRHLDFTATEIDDSGRDKGGRREQLLAKKRLVARPPHSRTSSRRVAIHDAVGKSALVAGSHVVRVTKSEGGFGIFISDELQVTSCAPRSPAETAGLQVGSTITKVNGRSVHSRGEFRSYTQEIARGDTVAFTCKNIISGEARTRKLPRADHGIRVPT